MARDTTRASTRVAVQERRRAPSVSVAASSNTAAAKSPLEGIANALADAVQSGGQAYKDVTVGKARDDFKQGSEDAALGQAAEDGSDAYMNGVNRVAALSDFEQMQRELDQEFQEMDLADLDEESASELLDEHFQGRFGGADGEPGYAQHLLPQLVEYRSEVLGRVREANRTAFENEQEGRLTEIASGLYEDATEAGEEFDYQELSDLVYGVFPGEAGDARYYGIVSSMAIEQGRPDLIEDLPDRWADGTPTMKNSDEFRRQRLSDIQTAENRRLQRVNAATAERSEYVDTVVSRNVFNAAAEGQDPTDYIRGELEAGNIDGFEANRLMGVFGTMQDYSREQAVNWEGLTELATVASRRPDQITQDDVFRAYTAGQFGDPRDPQVYQRVTDVLDRVEMNRRSRSTRSNIYAAPWFDRIGNLKPHRDSFGGISGGTEEEEAVLEEIEADFQHALARADLNDPEAVDRLGEQFMGRARERLAELNGDQGDDAQERNVRSAMQQFNGSASSQMRLSWATNQIERGLTEADLANGYEEGWVSEDEYIEALEAMARAHERRGR